MGRITKAIYPDAEIDIPEDDGKAQAERIFVYSPLSKYWWMSISSSSG